MKKGTISLKHMPRYLRYFIPFAAIICLMLILYFTDLHQYVSLEAIKEKQNIIVPYAKSHPILFPILFFLVYVLSVVLVIPDSTVLSVFGGFIFPTPFATFLIVTAETLGALLFFLALRLVFKGMLSKHMRFIPLKMQLSFQAHAANFLLFLRLSHILPFWLVTGCAAYFFTPLWTFVWTTFVGVIPLSYLLAQVGHNLSKLLASDEPLTLTSLFSPSIRFALLALGILALAPLIYQIWKEKKDKKK